MPTNYEYFINFLPISVFAYINMFYICYTGQVCVHLWNFKINCKGDSLNYIFLPRPDSGVRAMQIVLVLFVSVYFPMKTFHFTLDYVEQLGWFL